MTLTVRGLTKEYSGTRVLDGVDLTVAPGEVHALLGANGAGKSTLIKCIAGALQPTAGSIALDGDQLPDLSPSLAFAHGIAVIHQHPTLIGTLTVLDNLFLGQERTAAGVVQRRAERLEARELLDRFGLKVPLRELAGRLPIGAQQLLEIARAWHRTAIRVLILDEPTAALSATETERLFAEIRQLQRHGARIIYTTHRLGEVFGFADHITILRDGKVALSARAGDVDQGDLVRIIASEQGPASRRTVQLGPEVLSLFDYAGPRYGPISLSVRKGHIVGLYGVLGSGRTSLLETIAGRWRSHAGTARIGERRLRPGSVRRALALGVALVPSDRQNQAIWASRPAFDNLLVAAFRTLAIGPVRRIWRERRTFARLAQSLDLRPADPAKPAERFSGGNQQKLVLGRWLAQGQAIKLLLLDEPTQGVDVGARTTLYDLIRRLADDGAAVLFASSDAEEVAALADQALVLNQGRIVAQFEGAEITQEALLASAHQLLSTPDPLLAGPATEARNPL